MARTYKQLLNQTLQNNFFQRQEAWTESIAVGSKEFRSKTKRTLASKAISPLSVKFVQKWQKNSFMADKVLAKLKSEYRISKQYRMTKIQISKQKRVKLLTIS